MARMRRIQAVPIASLACGIFTAWLPAAATAAFLSMPVETVAAVPAAAASSSPNELLRLRSTFDLTEAASSSSSSCPANYYSCASQGSQFSGICCPYNEVCSLDSDNNPACCPSGDVCTGNAPSTYVTTTIAASYVPNSYYSFPYILPSNVAATTALADVAACDAVLQQCSSTYALCTADLEGSGSSSEAGSDSGSDSGSVSDSGGGDGIAVTIVISGSTTFTKGGTTAAAKLRRADATTSTLAAATAASICSSLRSVACGGLPTNSAGCSSVFSASTGTSTSASFSSDSGPSLQLRLPFGNLVVLATAAGALLAGAADMIMP